MEQVRTATKSQEEIGAAWERHLRGALLQHTGEVPVYGHLMKNGGVIREIDALLPKRKVVIELKRLSDPNYYNETVSQAKAQVSELAMHIDASNRGNTLKKLVIIIVDKNKIGPGIKLEDDYRVDRQIHLETRYFHSLKVRQWSGHENRGPKIKRAISLCALAQI
jgi:hypothetical protein